MSGRPLLCVAEFCTPCRFFPTWNIIIKPQTSRRRHIFDPKLMCAHQMAGHDSFFLKKVHMLPFPTFSGRNRRYIWTTGQLSLEGEAGRKKRGKQRKKFANCQKISSCSSKRKKTSIAAKPIASGENSYFSRHGRKKKGKKSTKYDRKRQKNPLCSTKRFSFLIFPPLF